MITSNQNPIIKELKTLKERKSRDETGLFLAEGVKFVEEAMKENVEIDKILYSDHLHDVNGGREVLGEIERIGYKTFQISGKLFKEISDTQSPQGIVAVVKGRKSTLDELIKPETPGFYLLLDCISDPGNMGTIIRTADAAGVEGIILSPGCVDIYNPKVLRSTMGSIFRVPIVKSSNLLMAMEILKSRGIKVIASHLSAKVHYFQLEMRRNIAIIIGNEANGIREEISSQADRWVKIPMVGKIESLNASVAASLLMYEVVRQRMSPSDA